MCQIVIGRFIMVSQKVKYYLTVSPAVRAADAAQCAPIARAYVVADTRRRMALNRISWLLSCDDNIANGISCIKQVLFREYYCPYFSHDVPCSRTMCPMRGVNNDYVACNQEYKQARQKLDEFWAEKYKKVK